MKSFCRGAAVALALLISACSGNFGTGTGIPQQGGGLPPLGGANSPMPENNGKGLPEPGATVSPLPSASPATYSIADAQDGFACPPMPDGYECRLSFNLPPPTPAPSASPKGHAKTTPTPSPSPSPSPSPQPTGSVPPSPSPTPAQTITMKSQALPAEAPKLVHTPPNSISVVPLSMVTLTTNADFPLDGWVNAQFTMPKEQYTKDRGFAVQLFSEHTKKKSVNYTPIWTFDRSTIDGNTLTFSFKPPKMKIAKGSTYVLVLYGDDISKLQPMPGGPATPSAAPSTAPSAEPAVAPEPMPSP